MGVASTYKTRERLINLTIEGKSAFVVAVFTELMQHEGSTIQKAMIEGVSEFQSREQITAIFNKALTDAGLSPD